MSKYIQNMSLKVGLAQIAPVWLNKIATTAKIIDYITKASNQGCGLVVFGEALLPGYPFWLSSTDGARFNDKKQKEIHAHYMKEAVCIEEGDLDTICLAAKSGNIAVYLGCIERPLDRGGHSIYCSLVFINEQGEIKSVHRKLQPTYEERLSWAPGDGNGLVTHRVGEFTAGGLNCWENWMPLSRTALYAQGENLHVGVWPGGLHNTHDLTSFIAKEGRSFVVFVSGLMTKDRIPKDIPHYEEMYNSSPDIMANGASCVCAPDGSWILEPVLHEEGLFCVELDLQKVYEERQNFDPAGHYSRPDITKLVVNKERQGILG